MTAGTAATRAQRWQELFDECILAAAVTAIVAVALQSFAKTGPLHIIGVVLAIAAWLVFVLDAAVMLTLVDRRAQWARSHWFDLLLLVLTCPFLIQLAGRALLLELLPAFTVLEAAKLAKLAKIIRLMRHRGSGRAGGTAIAALVVAGALIVGVLVLTH